MLKLGRLPFSALVVFALSSIPTYPQQSAAPEDFVPSHYTKYEFRIPMRDGKRLFTAVYIPKANAFGDQGPYPFLMDRTPYGVGPYGEVQLETAQGAAYYALFLRQFAGVLDLELAYILFHLIKLLLSLRQL